MLIVEETDDFGGTLILSNPSDIQNYYFFVSYPIFCLSFFFHSHDSHLYGLNLTQQFVLGYRAAQMITNVYF